MKRAFGYLIAGIGLIGMGFSSQFGQKILPVLDKVPKNFILIPSLILVGLGIVILIVTNKSSGKVKQVEKEVPIYRGKKIIGYRVED